MAQRTFTTEELKSIKKKWNEGGWTIRSLTTKYKTRDQAIIRALGGKEVVKAGPTHRYCKRCSDKHGEPIYHRLNDTNWWPDAKRPKGLSYKCRSLN